MKILHFSYTDDPKGAGVYFYIKELIRIQKTNNIDCYWITVINNKLVSNKKELLKKISDINPNIIHIHGIWTVCTRIMLDLKKISKNIIVSPHGMLNQRSINKSYIKKKIYFFLFEKRQLNQIKYFHALNNAEYDEIRFLFPDKPIKIINTGFQIYSKKKLNIKKELRNLCQRKKILLFLGRLDKIKGLLHLINSWKKLNKEVIKNDWWLFIAGFGPLSETIIKNSKKENSRIIFVGPIFDEEKDFLLHKSKAFILPSFNEGLPISILEALSFKNTCLITKNCNMDLLLEEDISVEIKFRNNIPLTSKAIEILFKLSEKELKKKEELGMEYLKKNHNWESIISENISFYKRVNSEE